MKTINLRGISEVLSEKELKNVMGGENGTGAGYTLDSCDKAGDCNGLLLGDRCTQSATGRRGTCIIWNCSWTKMGKTCAVGLADNSAGVSAYIPPITETANFGDDTMLAFGYTGTTGAL